MATTEKCCPKREPLSSDILQFAARLSERARVISEDMDSKLAPITLPCPPKECTGGEDGKNYPPLLGELNNYLSSISNSLNSIEDTLSRCEV